MYVIVVLTGMRSSTYLSLAKQATVIGAYKTARFAYDRLQVSDNAQFPLAIMMLLQSLHIPQKFHEMVDIATVTIRGKPLQDKEVLVVSLSLLYNFMRYLDLTHSLLFVGVVAILLPLFYHQPSHQYSWQLLCQLPAKLCLFLHLVW